MAKRKKLVSKQTKKKLAAAAPWAIAIAATGGMLAAFAERGLSRLRGKVRSIAAETVETIRPEKTERTAASGMVSGMVPQESGAV